MEDFKAQRQNLVIYKIKLLLHAIIIAEQFEYMSSEDTVVHDYKQYVETQDNPITPRKYQELIREYGGLHVSMLEQELREVCGNLSFLDVHAI